MRPRTAAAVLAITVVLAGLVAFGLGSASGTTLTERWVSDTPRDTQGNHHPLAVGPAGKTIVAPIAAVPGEGDQLSDTSCALVSLTPANGSVLWRNGVPPDRCMAHALTEPTIGDLEGDGTKEVVAATTEEAIVALDAASGTEEFRIAQPVYGYGPPVIADVVPAPGKEIVASDIGGNVVLAHANGSVAWRHSLNETLGSYVSVWDRPAIADVDGDGATEIAIGSREAVVVVSANGTIEWVGDAGGTYLDVAQADDDAASELFTADGVAVRAVDGNTHERAWEYRFGVVTRMTTVTDADGDGTLEVYVGLANGTAVALDARTGKVEWKTTVTTAEDGVLAAPVVAKTGDGERRAAERSDSRRMRGPAIVTAARDGTVVLLDPGSGAERAAYQRPVPVWTYPTPADIDDDVIDEILVRYGDGRVVALDVST